MTIKLKIIASLLRLSLLAPITVFAANVNSTLTISGGFTTNSNSQFTANLNNFQAPAGGSDVLTFSGATLADFQSMSYLTSGGWMTLTPAQSGSDVTAKFAATSGLDANAQRVVTFRVNFKNPKTYIVGFSLQTADGKTLSSSAAPLTVTGPKVLGSSVTVTFTRPLKYGMSGADVTALQNRLASEGLFAAQATGFFGRVTQAAVKAYQVKHGITPVNGVVGPLTLASLNQ